MHSKKSFWTNDEARLIWNHIRDRLDKVSIEFAINPSKDTIPLELMRESLNALPLIVEVSSFYYVYPALDKCVVSSSREGSLRILVVICRPSLDLDVSFRSIASRIVGSLRPDRFDIHVLRPPTFAQLEETLKEAHSKDRPFDIVHFDGHGTYVDLEQQYAVTRTASSSVKARTVDVAGTLRSVYPDTVMSGSRGYIYFENPKAFHNRRLVDGRRLGKALADTGVQLLVLNACKSARAEPAAKPTDLDGDSTYGSEQTWGSFAHEAMSVGVPSVVAMRYNVFVETAAQFVSRFYNSISEGEPVSQAVTKGKKHLHENRSTASWTY